MIGPDAEEAAAAGLASRHAIGRNDGDPDLLVGPRLTMAQRARLLRAAADAAALWVEP